VAEGWFPVVDAETCSECGKCVDFCQQGVFDKSSAKPIMVQPLGCVDTCHGCGNLCPTGSITYYGDTTGWKPPNRTFEN